MSTPEKISVEQIADPAQLERYTSLWHAMLAQTPQATFFHTLDWLLVYWKHCGHDQQLRVLIVWAGDRPVGILPLVIREERTRVGTIRVLTYPLHDWGTFYSPIGPDPAATLRAAMRYLREAPRDWDLLDLRWIDEQQADQHQTRQGMELAGFVPHRQAWGRAAVLEIDGQWDNYWKSRTKKWRESIRRYHRRLEAAGQLEFVRYRPTGANGNNDPRWDLYDACVKIAQSSWQGSSTTGSTLCHTSVADFLRDAHEAAVRTGSLDLCILKLDGQPIAFIYNYRHNGRLYGLRMGFDPESAKMGPGKVLQYLMFKDSFERGDEYFDMGVGSLEVKRHWLTAVTTSYRMTCFASSTLRTGLLWLKRYYVERRWGDEYLAGGNTAKQMV